ncbi:MAG: hypothetical protein ABIH83_05980 [Candidatus Micrarchaeota archaeon]
MYIDIANMTLEEVGKITSMLSSARVDAYLTKVGENAYLYTVAKEEHKGVIEPMLSEI